MAISDSLTELKIKLTDLIATTTAEATRQLDGSYEISVNVGAVEDSNSQRVYVRDMRLLKDELGKTHSLIVSVPVEHNKQDIAELQGIIDIVEAETKRLVIANLTKHNTSSTTDALKKLSYIIKELGSVAYRLDEHPDADSLLADLEVAERYMKKVETELQASLLASLRKAGEAYKEKISLLNEKLTLDDLIEREA